MTDNEAIKQITQFLDQVQPNIVEIRKYLTELDTPSRTCKNCKYSTPRSHDERLECRHWKVCNVDGHEPDGIDEWEAAEVSVGPDFGCIHFLDKHK